MPQRKAYDAVVLGAGIVGLACAWRTAERGMSVLVVDRAEPGAGASGAAAGMLAPVTEAAFGEEGLLRLGLEGARCWPGFRTELEARSGLELGFVSTGTLLVAVDRDDGEELRRRRSLVQSLELDAEWLGGRECRRLEPSLSPRVSGAIFAHGDHQVDPRAVNAALEAALRASEVEVLRGREAAVRIEDGAVAGVDVGEGRWIDAARVVAAPGADAAALAGVPYEALPPVRPVKGQIVRLRRRTGTPPLLRHVVRTLRGYVIDRPDGEVVVGATQEERGHDGAVTSGGVFALLEAAREVLPDVDELEWVEARAGLRPGTPDNGPIVGAASVPGLIWATGHHRAGVLLAPLTADAVAGLLAGEALPDALAAFGPERFEGPIGQHTAGRRRTAPDGALAR